MEEKIKVLFERWKKRNISACFYQGKEEAAEEMLKLIPQSASVGLSGSVTLNQLDIVARLEARGNRVFNQYKPGLSREENFRLRNLGMQADYYLASANAVSEKGELVFFSGYGNRTAGIAGAKNVIIVCGINKLTSDIQAAIKRAREYATPLNCKRLNWNTPCFADGICREDICLFPEYKRMCCQVLIIEAEVTPERLKVILINEKLGF